MLTSLVTTQAIANPYLRPIENPLQCTVAAAVSCVGIGVHSANPVTMTIRPASVNTGYVFIRTDIKENNRVNAIWHNVVETMLCTKIANAHGVSVSTIEHVIAALAGCGIHNAIIEVDGPEVPIMDGSSKVFVEMIDSVGFKKQSHAVKTLRILKPIQVSNEKGTAFLLPADEPRLTMQFNASGRLAPNNWSFTYYPEMDDFGSVLSEARTFGFYDDAQRLIAAGLAKGASLENTVVLNDDGVMNAEGLRYDDELIRHKLLDAIGDLALAGYRLLGHFDGVNSGHNLNYLLIKALFADPSAWVVESQYQAYSKRVRTA